MVLFAVVFVAVIAVLIVGQARMLAKEYDYQREAVKKLNEKK